MNKNRIEQQAVYLLSERQQQAISGLADLRRRQQVVTEGVRAVSTRKIPDNLASSYATQIASINRILSGAPLDVLPEKRDEAIGTSLIKADQFKDIAPNVAALHFAKAAALQQEAGLPYSKTREAAKRSSDRSSAEGIVKNTPADFLPDVYLLRIATKETAGVTLPSAQTVAAFMQHDQSLLLDYALVLKEDEREAFVAAFPPSKQHEISIQLDNAVSAVLSGKLITETKDFEQRDAVKERVREAFSQALSKLKLSQDDKEKDFGRREVGSRWSSRQLTETLVNLDETDSLQVLRDLALQTMRQLKVANKKKYLRHLPLDEKAEALTPLLSFTGHVLDTLIEVDTKRGGILAMRYLELNVLQERFFTFFNHKLIQEGYFTKELSPFLQEGNIPILKKLMAQYGTQFNTIVSTLSKTEGYRESHDLVSRQDELFEALADLGTLTPLIFEQYRKKAPAERKVFAEKIRDLKPKFFQNMPIKAILDKADKDILTEMVYLAYKPQLMNFESVTELIDKLDDYTDDLSHYTFPQEGYPLLLENAEVYVVKEGQEADMTMLRRFRSIFMPRLERSDVERSTTPFADALRSYLLSSEHSLSGPGQRNADEILHTLFAPIGADPQQAVPSANAYNALNELVEIAGHDFDEYYQDRLASYFHDYADDHHEVVEMLCNPQIQRAIDECLVERNQQRIEWDDYYDYNGNRDLVAFDITKLLRADVIEPMRIQLESELSKYTRARSSGAVEMQSNLKAYVSKNVGSFFAKAAAGLCTRNDIPLFEREDHFHINVVEDDETVRANNQAYVATVRGEPSLILRGFNPTAEWVGKIDAASYCEEILRVGKQFQEDNGLSAVYITDQDGAWHALSNREQPARYLIDTYITGKTPVPFTLQVSGGYDSGHAIHKIYKV